MCQLLRDWSTRAWLHVAGSTRRVWPRLGTKPGDPLAGLLCALAFLTFQKVLIRGLAAAGISETVELKGRGVFPTGGVRSQVDLLPPTYLYDFAVLVSAKDAVTLLRKVVMVASRAVEMAKSYGLRLNFRKGSPSAWRPGSKAAKRMLVSIEGAGGDTDVPAFAMSGGGFPRIVRSYRHLGIMATATSPIGQEVALRTAAGQVAHTALAKAVFNKADIPVPTRIGVAVAWVHSRCMYLAGMWLLLSGQPQRRFDAGMMRPLRIICGVHKPPAEGELHVPSLEVLRRLRRASPAWILIIACFEGLAAGSRLHAGLGAVGRWSGMAACSHRFVGGGRGPGTAQA